MRGRAMAVEPAAAAILRGDLAALDGISEKPMFGGLGFMRGGHLLAGVTSGGGFFYRTGKSREVAAQAHPGVAPFADASGRRKMGGFVILSPDHRGDGATRAALLDLALQNAAELPPKE